MAVCSETKHVRHAVPASGPRAHRLSLVVYSPCRAMSVARMLLSTTARNATYSRFVNSLSSCPPTPRTRARTRNSTRPTSEHSQGKHTMAAVPTATHARTQSNSPRATADTRPAALAGPKPPSAPARLSSNPLGAVAGYAPLAASDSAGR